MRNSTPLEEMIFSRTSADQLKLKEGEWLITFSKSKFGALSVYFLQKGAPRKICIAYSEEKKGWVLFNPNQGLSPFFENKCIELTLDYFKANSDVSQEFYGLKKLKEDSIMLLMEKLISPADEQKVSVQSFIVEHKRAVPPEKALPRKRAKSQEKVNSPGFFENPVFELVKSGAHDSQGHVLTSK